MDKIVKRLIPISILIMMLFLAGCGKEKGTYNAGSFSVCEKSDLTVYIEREFGTYNNPDFILPRALEDGCACEVYEDTARYAIEANLASYWYPITNSTVILAIDRTKTDLEISSFKELLDSDLKYAVSSYFSHNSNICIWALRKGAGFENYPYAAFVAYLALEAGKDRYVREVADADVVITLDDSFESYIPECEKYEIVYPADGTYSIKRGLLSKYSLPVEKLNLHSFYRPVPTNSKYVEDIETFAERTERTVRDTKKYIFGNKRLGSSEAIEGMMLALCVIVVIIIWLGISLKLVINPNIRKIILLIGTCIILWITVRFVKYQIVGHDTFDRYLWYSYYIFELAAPMLLLWLSAMIDKVKSGGRKEQRVKIIALSVYLTLVIAVFTNDLHNLVFSFDVNGNWNENYTYGPLYYGILAGGLIMIIAALITLIVKAKRGHKKAGIYSSVALMLLFLAYTAAYVIGVSWVKESDVTIIHSIFIILYIELCMVTGIIPRNKNSSLFFVHSPLKLQLVDKNGKTILSSKYALPLSDNVFKSLKDNNGEHLYNDNNTLFHMSKIRGGYVIWEDDVSEIVLLNKEINRNIRLLESANKVLDAQKRMIAVKASDDTKNKLQTKLESEIKVNYDRLINMIYELPSKEDKKLEVARITLLLVYIKRRCNLFFREIETKALPADELCVYIDELAEFAKFTGVLMLTGSNIKTDITTRHATLVYDFLYAVLVTASKIGEYNVIEQLIISPDRNLELKLLLNDFITDIGEWELELRAKIIEQDGTVIIKDLEDTVGISLIFKEEQ